MLDDVSKLTKLGSTKTEYFDKAAPEVLETFSNQFPENQYKVKFETCELTSLCPRTGQPDFGTISIEYIPGEKCIESKSLKLYLYSYRTEKTFMETLTNRILTDLVKCCNPKEMCIIGNFNARGGITTTVTAGYSKK